MGYNKYSVIGWSEGAKVALLMAIKYPESVQSLVLTAISTHYSKKGLNSMLSSQSVDKWPKDKLKDYLNAYKSKDEIQSLWTRFIKFIEHYIQYFPEDIFKDKYKTVKCPVLMIHGEQVNENIDV